MTLEYIIWSVDIKGGLPLTKPEIYCENLFPFKVDDLSKLIFKF